MMAYQYKRRRLAIVRNFWVYRRLIGAAVLLGLMLWFIWANSAPVIVKFPFGLGEYTSTVGVVMLLTALVSSVATILVVTLILAIKRIRGPQAAHEQPHRTESAAERPPPDYAAKTTEGFSNAQWSN
jgi:uncharacterized integral membrane protein